MVWLQKLVWNLIQRQRLFLSHVITLIMRHFKLLMRRLWRAAYKSLVLIFTRRINLNRIVHELWIIIFSLMLTTFIVYRAQPLFKFNCRQFWKSRLWAVLVHLRWATWLQSIERISRQALFRLTINSGILIFHSNMNVSWRFDTINRPIQRLVFN